VAVEGLAGSPPAILQVPRREDLGGSIVCVLPAKAGRGAVSYVRGRTRTTHARLRLPCHRVVRGATQRCEHATACVCYPWKRKEASIGVLYLPASDAKDDLVSITMR